MSDGISATKEPWPTVRKQPWYMRRSDPERRVAEAALIASDVELDLAIEAGAKVPRSILNAFKSADRLDQVEGALEFRRWKAMLETQPQLALTHEIIREALVRAAGGAPPLFANIGNPPQNDDDYRAAINGMLDELRRIYALVQTRDRVFGRIRRSGLTLLVVLFAILISTRWLDGMGAGMANLTEIAAAGGLGALVSIIRRLQDANSARPLSTDPVQQISALREGYPSIIMAALTGPLFALTLFVVFASGLVSIEGLTPKFEACERAACNAGYFTVMNLDVQFKGIFEAMKMLLWGFVAGFAEKLVPDVLDKISGSLPARMSKTG